MIPMKAITALIFSVLLPLAGLPLSGCSSSPDQRSTGQTFDDAGITARVKTAIARDASIGEAMDVNVNTYRGVVQLSGFVDSPEAIKRAGEIAQGGSGVQSVANALRVKPKRTE
jgi:osmotically-inducible protein OsmY